MPIPSFAQLRQLAIDDRVGRARVYTGREVDRGDESLERGDVLAREEREAYKTEIVKQAH